MGSALICIEGLGLTLSKRYLKQKMIKYYSISKIMIVIQFSESKQQSKLHLKCPTMTLQGKEE